MTNTNKLKGRMVENGYTLSGLAEALNISRPALRKKINGSTDFKVSEIESLCSASKIDRKEITDFFFADDVPILERIANTAH